jgi:hypothetical protein
MKTKSKTVLIVVSTLVVGFALGSFSTVLYLGYKKRSRYERTVTNKDKILLHLERILNLSESQIEQITPILDQYRKNMFRIKSTVQQDILASSDSLKTQLAPYLSEEQKKLLEKEFQMRSKNAQKRRRHPQLNR